MSKHQVGGSRACIGSVTQGEGMEGDLPVNSSRNFWD